MSPAAKRDQEFFEVYQHRETRIAQLEAEIPEAAKAAAEAGEVHEAAMRRTREARAAFDAVRAAREEAARTGDKATRKRAREALLEAEDDVIAAEHVEGEAKRAAAVAQGAVQTAEATLSKARIEAGKATARHYIREAYETKKQLDKQLGRARTAYEDDVKPHLPKWTRGSAVDMPPPGYIELSDIEREVQLSLGAELHVPGTVEHVHAMIASMPLPSLPPPLYPGPNPRNAYDVIAAEVLTAEAAAKTRTPYSFGGVPGAVEVPE